MLSLLSLLLASGTVLRADTDEWTSTTYPDPRLNSTLCNTWANSTLCDPDHMLTDFWRNKINENIIGQMEKLKETKILYTDKAPISCLDNSTEPIKIYVLLAKRIRTAKNQSISETDLTNFGNELAKRFGLDEQPCKNFLLLIGIEAAKLAYVRTGKDLKLPADLMQRIFHEYNSFNAKNYMEGLNKIVDEIGVQITDPFKDLEELIHESTATPKTGPVSETFATTGEFALEEEFERAISLANESLAKNATALLVEGEAVDSAIVIKLHKAPWLIFLLMFTSILLTTIALLTLCFVHIRRQKLLKMTLNQSAQLLRFNNGKQRSQNVERRPEGHHSASIRSSRQLSEISDENYVSSLSGRSLNAQIHRSTPIQTAKIRLNELQTNESASRGHYRTSTSYSV